MQIFVELPKLAADTENHLITVIMNHKFYLNSDDKKIGGVCSGFAAYFNVDVTLIRIVMLCLLLLAGCGLLFYIICWVLAPTAYTAEEKCALRSLEPTPENLAKSKDTTRA